MKKLLYSIASVLFFGTALVSCSDDEIVSDGGSITLEQALEPSEIDIALEASADEPASKAAIKSNSGAFSTDNLGVFMLAMEYINTADIPYWGAAMGMDCSWYRDPKQTKDSETYRYTYGYTAFLDNLKATAQPKDSSKPASGSSINLGTGIVDKYPIGSFHRYNFYAYTPRVPKIEYRRDSVTAIMTTLDGTQDVIYSAAIPGDKYNKINTTYKDYAWSANYFRFAQNRTGNSKDEALESKTPNFHFTHKMSQLMFSVQPGGVDKKGNPVDEASKTSALNYDKALETEIVGISICNVPDSVFLLVAERAGLHNGNIRYSSENRSKEFFLKSYIGKKVGNRTIYYPDQMMEAQTLSTEEVPVVDEEGEPVLDKKGKQVTEEVPVVNKLGGPDDDHRQGIILPALTNEDRKTIDGSYIAKFVVRYPRSSEDAKYYTINIPLYSDPENPNMQFEEGCSYELKFRIYGPNNVQSAGVQENNKWYEVDVDDLRESGNYNIPEEDTTAGN